MASDDEDGQEYEIQEGKSGIVFLIDARFSMFTKDYEDEEDNQQTRFNIALKCCRNLLMNKIIAKQKDLVGVVLFGTAKSDSETKTKHVSLLQEPNYPDAPAVKELDRLLEDVDSKEVQSTYGSSDEFLLAHALWFCSSLFSRSRQNLIEKRILLFTDDSNPHGTHADRAHMAYKRATDLNKVGITLEIIPLGSSFDYSVFYKELVETVSGHADPETQDPVNSSRLEDLLDRVNRLEFKRRRYAKLKWNLGKDVFVGVSLYTLYSEAKVLPTENLSRATNEPVKRVKQTYDQATGELLLPSDIEEFVAIAGSEITFTPEEKEALGKLMEPGMNLLGFKPSTVVSVGDHCGQPHFIYPEETLIKGSRSLVKALVERCIAKQKVAVVCMTPRFRAVTKYFYLVPSEETYDSNGRQLTPCGFHAIPIPFNNDVREKKGSNDLEGLVVSPLCFQVVRKVVNKLKMSYKPGDFKNPKLQLFWQHLEALALEKETPKSIEDSTIPDLNAQTERLGPLADELIDIFELNPYPSTGCKRGSRMSSGPSKRAKNEDIDILKEVGDAIKTKQVEKFTVAQLKEFLTLLDRKTTHLKRKADFVYEVYNVKLPPK